MSNPFPLKRTHHKMIDDIPENTIDIWQFSLKESSPILESVLDSTETDRALRFYFDRHRRRFIAARAAMRSILSLYLKKPAKELVFSYNQFGKPEFENKPIQFNLSHSKELGLLVIDKHHPVGIDVEFFSARPYIGIGNHLYSVIENQLLEKCPHFLKPLFFFHVWAQKEALIKACGQGLSYPTKQFDLPHFPPSRQSIIDPVYQQHWTIHSFTPEVACCAAVCHDVSITEYRFFNVQRLEPFILTGEF